jgi:predicted nuclease of predicted toxin-antitoxin system
MSGAPDGVIAAYAKRNQLALNTCDFDFADIRNYPPANYAGILVLKLQENATASKSRRLWKSSSAARNGWLT